MRSRAVGRCRSSNSVVDMRGCTSVLRVHRVRRPGAARSGLRLGAPGVDVRPSPRPREHHLLDTASTYHQHVDTSDAIVSRYDGVPSARPRLQRLAEDAGRIAEVPGVTISLIKSASLRTIASVGSEVTVLAREHALGAPVLAAGVTVHVHDASRDPRWAHNPWVDGRWAAVRFLGIHPLIVSTGQAIGTLCVVDARPRTLSAEQVAALDALASDVVVALDRELERPNA